MTNNPSNDNDLENDELFWSLEDDESSTPSSEISPSQQSSNLIQESASTPEILQESIEDDFSFALPDPSHPVVDPNEPSRPRSEQTIQEPNITPPPLTEQVAYPQDDLGDLDDIEDLESPFISSSQETTTSTQTGPSQNKEDASEETTTTNNINHTDTLQQDTLPDTSSQDPKKFQAWSGKEKLGLICFAVLLVSLLGFWINHFYKHSEITAEYSWSDTLPTEGQIIHIESAKSYWKPATDSDVKLGIKYVPEILLTISSKSKDGALRIGFKNFDGKFVGDPKIESIKNGKFDNGTNQKTIYCTDGLLDEASLRGYLAQNELRWSVHLTESKSAGSSLIDENYVGQLSISPYFNEE